MSFWPNLFGGEPAILLALHLSRSSDLALPYIQGLVRLRHKNSLKKKKITMLTVRSKPETNSSFPCLILAAHPATASSSISGLKSHYDLLRSRQTGVVITTTTRGLCHLNVNVSLLGIRWSNLFCRFSLESILETELHFCCPGQWLYILCLFRLTRIHHCFSLKTSSRTFSGFNLEKKGHNALIRTESLFSHKQQKGNS